MYAGTYMDTVTITRPNITVYGQTLFPDSYIGNSAFDSASDMPEDLALTLVYRVKR